jgi:hypothetical protein
MSDLTALIIENGSFLAMFCFCLYGVYLTSRYYKTVPGVDLLMIGFLVYGVYALLAVTGPGFTGSYFNDFSRISKLNSQNYVYFISFALRLGLLLVMAGLLKVGRGSKA